MQKCQDYQNLLLEYLYELLETEEQSQMDEHLAQCDTCQEALRKTQQQKNLLAQAALCDVPTTPFQKPDPEQLEKIEPVETTATAPTPAESTVAETRGITLKSRSPQLRSARWTSWLAAASVLFTLAFAGWHGLQYLSAQSRIKQHNSTVAHLKDQRTDLNNQLASLQKQQKARFKAIEKEVRRRQLRLEITGPETVQAGASSEFRIHSLNGLNEPVPTELSYRFKVVPGTDLEKKDRAVLSKALTQLKGTSKSQDGTHRLKLPPDLPLKPETRLSLELFAKADTDQDKQVRLSEKLELSAPRYLARLSTDKPMYHPGDTVRFHSLVLERFRLRPASESMQLVYVIRDPKGGETVVLRGGNQLAVADKNKNLKLLRGPDDNLLRGVGAGEWWINPNLPGGEYAVIVREANHLFPEQERKFLVQKYQKPRMTKKLDLHRKSYGPGDEVVALGQALWVENSKPVESDVFATVQIDDQQIDENGKPTKNPIHLRTDAEGRVQARFRLPEKIETGRASVSLKFVDQGGAETILRPIPIVLKKLLVDFYPEGGDLIAEADNRVYFQVRTPLGKPAELAGRIMAGEKVVQEIATANDDTQVEVNRGLGAFTFVPQAGQKYHLEIDTPMGMDQKPELAQAKTSGVAMTIPTSVTTTHEPIEVTLANVGKARSLLIGAYCRGRLIDHVSVRLAAQQSATIPLLTPRENENPDDIGGVYRITVFEQKPKVGAKRSELIPLAERLVYRDPRKKLNIELLPASKTALPGGQVQLGIKVRREDQQKTPAVVLLSVVDNRVLDLADEKTARTMPTHFYLTSELHKPEDIEYADFLLTPHPKAEQSLDLLLGTQGWRRFAEQNPEQLREKAPEDADRFLALTGQRKETLMLAQAENNVAEFAMAKLEEAENLHNESRQKLLTERRQISNQLATTQEDVSWQRAAQKHRAYERFWTKTWPLLMVLGFTLILSIAVYLLASRLWIHHDARLFYAPIAVSAIVVLLLIVGISSFQEANESAESRESLALQKNAAPRREMGELELRDFAGADGGGGAGGATPEGAGDDNGVNEMADHLDLNVDGKAVAQDKAAPDPDLVKAENKGLAPGKAPKAHQEKQNRNRPDLDRLKADPEKEFIRNLSRLQKLQREELVKQQAVLRELDAQMADLKAKQENGNRGAELKRALVEKIARQKLLWDRMRLAARPNAMPQEGAKGGELKKLEDLRRVSTIYVRKYAYLPTRDAKNDIRRDFTETVYWHPVLVLPEGEKTVHFTLSDSITTWRVLASGHTLDGRLGAATTRFESQLPFYLDSKTPHEVTLGDIIEVPVRVVNNSGKDREVQLDTDSTRGLQLQENGNRKKVTVLARQKAREIYTFKPSIQEGRSVLRIFARGGPLGTVDALERSILVVPPGFPVAEAHSGVLENSEDREITLPEKWIPGTLKVELQAFPSTLADLQRGLEGMLRQPHGCFEQSSSSNYPNVMILNYLRESEQANPQLETRVRGLLEDGYRKLTSYECQDTQKNQKQGYEWFGGTAPPHEALTAYGLLQFRDMAQTYPVNQQMLKRTQDYLMSRRDGKGGFLRNQKALDSFGRAPKEVTDAYIVWALTESKSEGDLETELKALQKQAETSKDAYFLSLVGNSLMNRDQTKEALAILQKVVEQQAKDGSLNAATTSITGSGGRNLKIETTALAVLGWLKADRGTFEEPIRKAVEWLGQQRNPHGGFGTTQATILTLKALLAHAKVSKTPLEAGELSIWIGEKKVAQRLFSGKVSGAIELEMPNVEKWLKPGSNKLRINVTGKNVFPYTLSWSYRTDKPLSDDKYPVELTTSLNKANLGEGDTVRLKVNVENVSGKGQGMAVAIVGLPGGLSLPEDMKQLKEYAKLPADGSRPLVSAYEIRGRELILYWRDLAPNQKIEVPIDLICRVPGVYQGPASRAYLYYNPDFKHWVHPLKVTIRAR